jgi:PIN domain nuclease of toxin-antitoxin system
VASEIVLDASALLALLNGEPGSEEVEHALPRAVLSAVNLSEVIAKLSEAGMSQEVIRLALGQIQLDIRPFDISAAYRAGALRAQTKDRGLSFGDRACLALAQEIATPVLTADRDWREVDVGVEVRLIR